MQPPITLITGARPNFMKIAPLVKALDARGVAGGSSTPGSTTTNG